MSNCRNYAGQTALHLATLGVDMSITEVIEHCTITIETMLVSVVKLCSTLLEHLTDIAIA